MKINIRLVYLYLFSFVGLLTVVIGSVRMVDLALKVLVFTEADRYEYTVPMKPAEPGAPDESEIRKQALRDQSRTRQRDFTGAFAMIAVGLPLYLYHWRVIQKENKRS